MGITAEYVILIDFMNIMPCLAFRTGGEIGNPDKTEDKQIACLQL